MSQIIPDDKNWTFVLEETCGQCHQDVRQTSLQDVLTALPEVIERYLSALHRPDARKRTNPTRWSDQEYVVHVAEVFLIMEQRLRLMLNESAPTFPNWDQDQAADEGNYNALSSQAATTALREAATHYATTLAGISPEHYERRGLRSNGSSFTVYTLNQYAWHDILHHLTDLGA